VSGLNDRRSNSQRNYVPLLVRRTAHGPPEHTLAAVRVERANELGLPVLCHEILSCADKHATTACTVHLGGRTGTGAAAGTAGSRLCFLLRRRNSEPEDVLDRLAQEPGAWSVTTIRLARLNPTPMRRRESSAHEAVEFELHRPIGCCRNGSMRPIRSGRKSAACCRNTCSHVPCRGGRALAQPLPEWHTRVTRTRFRALAL